MLDFDLETEADVVLIPRARGRREPESALRGVSLSNAIRYVVEEVPRDAKDRAVIRTPSHDLFIDEIEAIYEQPEFPR